MIKINEFGFLGGRYIEFRISLIWRWKWNDTLKATTNLWTNEWVQKNTYMSADFGWL